ncbi:MAG: hypothetical protein RSF67_00680 [Clostridia bacterium]
MKKIIISILFIIGYTLVGNVYSVLAVNINANNSFDNLNKQNYYADYNKAYNLVEKQLKEINEKNKWITQNASLVSKNNIKLNEKNLTKAEIKSLNENNATQKIARESLIKKREKLLNDLPALRKDLEDKHNKAKNDIKNMGKEKEWKEMVTLCKNTVGIDGKCGPETSTGKANKAVSDALEAKSVESPFDNIHNESQNESQNEGFNSDKAGTGGTNPGGTKDENFFDKLLTSVNNWNGMKKDDSLGTILSEGIKKWFMEPIFLIGNLVIFVVAIVLGLKYVWSGIEAKTDIKETLPTFLIGVVFFYLADGIYKLINGSLSSMIMGNNTFSSISSNIFSTVGFIVNIGAIIGFIIIGIKYMFGSATEKADYKTSLIPATIGIILIYCVNNVIQFIYKIGTELL